jgi:ABC-type transporter Mla subunit MlaD
MTAKNDLETWANEKRTSIMNDFIAQRAQIQQALSQADANEARDLNAYEMDLFNQTMQQMDQIQQTSQYYNQQLENYFNEIDAANKAFAEKASGMPNQYQAEDVTAGDVDGSIKGDGSQGNFVDNFMSGFRKKQEKDAKTNTNPWLLYP